MKIKIFTIITLLMFSLPTHAISENNNMNSFQIGDGVETTPEYLSVFDNSTGFETFKGVVSGTDGNLVCVIKEDNTTYVLDKYWLKPYHEYDDVELKQLMGDIEENITLNNPVDEIGYDYGDVRDIPSAITFSCQYPSYFGEWSYQKEHCVSYPIAVYYENNDSVVVDWNGWYENIPSETIPADDMKKVIGNFNYITGNFSVIGCNNISVDNWDKHKLSTFDYYKITVSDWFFERLVGVI